MLQLEISISVGDRFPYVLQGVHFPTHIALLLTKTLILALLLCVETIPTTWVAATSDDILAFLGLSTVVEPWEVTPARTGGFDLTHIACTNINAMPVLLCCCS